MNIVLRNFLRSFVEEYLKFKWVTMDENIFAFLFGLLILTKQ